METLKPQIIATIGPASWDRDILKSMIEHGLDVIRLNFSWGDLESREKTINLIRELEKEYNKNIPIIVDLPGPRIQEETGHTYDNKSVCAITDRDKEFIKFAVEHNVEYVAVSFVCSSDDIVECKNIIKSLSGTQKVIAKIERAIALESLPQIIKEADAVMVARGDLGNEIAIEKIPFVQDDIIKMAKKENKSVIVATQMLFSMVENKIPTRAEVTDVASAILQGADAVMLSEESATGKYPIEAVMAMEKIVIEAEKHRDNGMHFNGL